MALLGRAGFRRAEAGAAAWLRSAPGTYTYLFALLVTSWSLQNIDPRLADLLIRSQSTNLDNLTDRPLQVLVSSAFWTSGSALPWQLLLRFTLIMAPVERRLGTRRTFGIFAAGHVIATLLVASGLEYGVRHGMLDIDLAHAPDVGVSYGLLAVGGALTWLIVPALWRPVWVLVLLASTPPSIAGGLTFTGVGHFLSLLTGLCCAPLVRRWQRDPAPHAVKAGRPLRILVRPLSAGPRADERERQRLPDRRTGEQHDQAVDPET